VRREFPDGGYYILGSDFETDKEVRLIVDAGPLGFRSIAAHGHADALSFTLSIAGREFLTDPGTYAYHTKQKWRNYFRGTSAHNTVRVDGVDQSVIAGNFMWSRKAEARCEVWRPADDYDYFCGSHNGYSRLDDPVTHRREIRLDKIAHIISVTDTLACNGEHEIEQFWHFSEDCRIKLQGAEIVVENGDVRLLIETPDDAIVEAFKSQENPPLGWVSRRFDIKVPATTVVVRSRIHGTIPLPTKFFIKQ
jgi:uncharacterized heparinase superfamily protein